jgi:Fe-S-cluster containining protein
MGERLDALYAELPQLKCKGKCWKCCGKVLMGPGERERISREGGVDLPTVAEMRRDNRELCVALKSHRCTVYDVRPLVCRLWGIEETMRCPYGCVPEGGWMTTDEATGFRLRAWVIAGWSSDEDERLSPKQVADRLREHEKAMSRLPGGRPARILPDDEPAASGSGLLRRWRRSA